MKTLLTLFVMFFSFSSIGKGNYTIPIPLFIEQFSNPCNCGRLYAINEDGEKVTLAYHKNGSLTLRMKSGKKKEILFYEMKYGNDIIEAHETNSFSGPNKQTSNINISEVESISIASNWIWMIRPYYNVDSLHMAWQQKNDSLQQQYTSGKEWVIYLKHKSKGDTLLLQTNACYHIDFRNETKTEWGVITNISRDSIYISNSFNEAMAVKAKKQYTVYKYPISEIAGLRLVKSHHFGYRKVSIDDYNIVVVNVDKSTLSCPYWYGGYSFGVLLFYRSWLTDSGFPGITEVDGNATWYEGG